MTVSLIPPKLRRPMFWYWVSTVAIALAVAAGGAFLG
jgi:hypothetical protein